MFLRKISKNYFQSPTHSISCIQNSKKLITKQQNEVNFLIFNKKKLQQLRNILIYIQDRNSIQIITCRRSMKKTIIR